MSVRLRLLLLALCVTLPCLAAAAWAIAATYYRERESVEQRLRETARALALVVDRELGRREAVAWTLAGSASIASGDIAGFDAQARAATARMGGWVVLFGPKGMVANTSVPFGAPLPLRGEARARIQRKPGADVSNLFQGPATGKPVIAISVPVNLPGSDAQGVSVVLLPEHLQRVLEEQRLPDGWTAAILDAAGTVVARQPNPQRWVGHPATPGLRERLRTDAAGVFSGATLDGTPTRTVFDKVPSYGWTFVIGVPQALVYANVQRSLLELAGAAVTLFLLAGVAAVLAGRKLVVQAKQLQTAAQALGAGTPVVYRARGVRELDMAGAMLTSASQQLANAKAVLEQRVAEAIDATRLAQERLAETQQIEAQRRLADAQQHANQLALVNEALAEKNRELNEANRLKSEFLSNMSHELRTPLNAIIGFSEMLKDGQGGELSPKQIGYVRHVFESGEHLLALISDILDLSKIEAGKVEIEFAPLDLDALISDSMAVIEARARAKDIRVARETGPAIGTLRLDRRRVRQILDNLLSNALKFTPAGGQVRLSAGRVDRARAAGALPGFAQGMRLPLADDDFQSFVEISVLDTGIGIQAQDTRRLFTPFTQISSVLTRSVEGTGLGLAMVRRLAELHGGAVAMTSEPGSGSCFTVWLPWREDTAPVNEPVPVVSPGTAPLALVVEDDEAAAALMHDQLEAEGFRVCHASSAEAAFELASHCTPDVITLDILLPGMDGWDFLSRLKEVPQWEEVPVVVVSVVADQGRGFSLGASLVLTKPVGRDALANGLARLGLAPNSMRSVTVLVIDDDPGAVEILATHLQRSQHTVLRALGGREGIALARRFRPDLIALDLEMPEINGFDVVEALKDDPSTANIPIVIVTARQLSARDRTQLNGHILDIVDKAEFNHGRFIGEVRRALSRSQTRQHP